MTGGKKDVERVLDRHEAEITDHGREIAELKAYRDADLDRANERIHQLQQDIRRLKASNRIYSRAMDRDKWYKRGEYRLAALVLAGAGIILKYEPELAEKAIVWISHLLSSTKN